MSTVTSRRHWHAGGLTWVVTVVSRESVLFLTAAGMVGIHIVGDNFVQPESGTSAGDHLASGLMPVAVLAAIAVVYPRVRAFLIHADPGLGGENTRGPIYYAAAGEPKVIWKVPGSKHTGGMHARPAEYERRVIDFFDRALTPTD